jgi:hypothetical protein
MKINNLLQEIMGGLWILICSALISCTFSPNGSISSTPTIAPNNDTPGFVSGSYITNTSIAKMVSQSSLIVIAQVLKADHIINMARDVKDPSQSAKDVYGVGQVYQVKIVKVIKGNETGSIYLVQPEGFLGATESKSETDIINSKKRYDSIPMSLGKEYIMFLRPMLSYPEEKLFVGNGQPWRFDISDPDKVIPESPWTFAIQVFPPQPLDTFLEQIAHPEKITPLSSAYPSPQQLPLVQPAYPAPQKP